jgi:hypothetical protein
MKSILSVLLATGGGVYHRHLASQIKWRSLIYAWLLDRPEGRPAQEASGATPIGLSRPDPSESVMPMRRELASSRPGSGSRK